MESLHLKSDYGQNVIGFNIESVQEINQSLMEVFLSNSVIPATNVTFVSELKDLNMWHTSIYFSHNQLLTKFQLKHIATVGNIKISKIKPMYQDRVGLSMADIQYIKNKHIS